MGVTTLQGFYNINVNRFSERNIGGSTSLNLNSALTNSSGDTIINFTGASPSTVTLLSASTIYNFFGKTASGAFFIFRNNGTADLTLQTPDGNTIEKQSTYILKPGDACQLFYDGVSNWFVALLFCNFKD